MRRIALPLGRRLVVAVAALAALVATLPLRVALGALGLPAVGVAARDVEGSVWSGRLVEARIGGMPLGDVAAHVRPLPLLVGRARIDLARGDDAARGALTIGRHLLGIDDMTADLPIARLFAPLPIRALALGGVSVRFRDGVCDAADGTVRADLAGDSGGVTLPGAFTGSARCDAGALLLPLASAGGDRLTLRLTGTGRYHADLALRAADPAALAKLTAAGFASAADGTATLAIDGSL